MDGSADLFSYTFRDSSRLARRLCGERSLMPFIDLALGSKPVAQIAPVFATALLPEFMRALSNLFFEAHVFVHVEEWRGSLVIGCFLHGRKIRR